MMDREELERLAQAALRSQAFHTHAAGGFGDDYWDRVLDANSRRKATKLVLDAVLPAIEDQWEQVGWVEATTKVIAHGWWPYGWVSNSQERPRGDVQPVFRRRSPETRGDKDR